MYHELPIINDESSFFEAFVNIPPDTTVLDMAMCLCKDVDVSIERIEQALGLISAPVKCLRLGFRFIKSRPIDEVVRILNALPKSITSLDLSGCFPPLRPNEEVVEAINAISEQVTAVAFTNNNTIPASLYRTNVKFRTPEETLTMIKAFRPTLMSLDLRESLTALVPPELMDEYKLASSFVKHVLLNDEDAKEKMTRELRLMELIPKMQEYALDVTELEWNPSKTPKEEMLLKFLREPSTRYCASEIVELASNSERTASQNWRLQLLLNPHTRVIVSEIISLEEKMMTSPLEDKEAHKLSIYYFRLMLNTPIPTTQLFDSPLKSFSTVLLEFSGPPLSPTCHTLTQPNTYSSLFHRVRTDRFTPVKRRINSIDGEIDRQVDAIITHYLQLNRVPPALQITSTMKVYVLEQRQFLSLALKKYFASNETPDYSADNLETLVACIKEALSTHQLQLSNKGAFLDLDYLVSQLPYPRVDGAGMAL